MKFTPQTMKAGLAIIGIVILEVVALLNHIDGALLGLSIAAIAGLCGYEIGIHRKPK